MRLPQRSLRSEDGRTAEAALPLGQGSGRLAGRGLAGVFPQGGSGLRLVGLGCVVAPGAGAGRRTVWKGSGWRLSELGATGSGDNRHCRFAFNFLANIEKHITVNVFVC